MSYHQHNRASAGPAILARLLAGESCALVTDAGTPAISDPGEDLVRLCADNGVPVQAVPGCCALITALAVSGLATGRFVFEGFLPVNRGERRERLAKLACEERTMIFYEAPHRLRATLDDLLSAFGDRPAALCRELTKLHEETLRLSLEEGTARVLALRAEGVKMKDAVRQVAAATGLGRNELYQAALQRESP